MELVSVAALAENRVIGNGGDVPWDLPEDKQQYRALVAGSPVVFGRRTFEMFEALPGTAQIVLSRTEREFDAETAHYAGSVDEAVEVAEALGAERAYVLGGGGIYDLFQPHLDRMVLTRVPGEYEGDAHYPAWDEAAWELVDSEAYESFTVETRERRGDRR